MIFLFIKNYDFSYSKGLAQLFLFTIKVYCSWKRQCCEI